MPTIRMDETYRDQLAAQLAGVENDNPLMVVEGNTILPRDQCVEWESKWYKKGNMRKDSYSEVYVPADAIKFSFYSDDTGEDMYFSSQKNMDLKGYSLTSGGSFVKTVELKKLLDYKYAQWRIDDATEDHPFLIGFEVEKQDDCFTHPRDYGESPLGVLAFAKLATAGIAPVYDSSVGFELVTPAMNLTDKSAEWRTATLNNEEFRVACKAQISSSCSTHLNLSQMGVSGKDMREDKLSEIMPLLMVMYQSRMKSGYCAFRPKTDCEYKDDQVGSLTDDAAKYQVAVNKGSYVELRLFSAIKSLPQLKWRWILMQILLTDRKQTVANALKSKFSKLYRHLSKVFSKERITQISKEYKGFYSFWNKGLLDGLPKNIKPTIGMSSESQPSTELDDTTNR